MKAEEIELIFDGENLNDYNGLVVDVEVSDGFINVTVNFEE